MERLVIRIVFQEALQYSENHIELDRRRFNDDLRNAFKKCTATRLVRIFTELAMNDVCDFEERSHRTVHGFFYSDNPLLEGWTNNNYMQRVSAALRVDIVEFIEDGKSVIGDSPITRVRLHSLFTAPVENWIFISTRYNTSTRNTLQSYQRRVDHRTMYGLCQDDSSYGRDDRELMASTRGNSGADAPFMMDHDQITHVLISLWHLECTQGKDVNGPYAPTLTQSEVVQNNCNQHCYSADWQATHSTLTSEAKIVDRALNDNNVLRMLLTLSWVKGATEDDFNLGFRKHNESATCVWSRHLGNEHDEVFALNRR